MTPLKADGPLILPPISVPIERGMHLAAIRPASPPELPAVDLVLSCGFNAVPYMLL